MMVRPELIRRKLSSLAGYLTELEAFRGLGFDAYAGPGGPRRTVERLLQLIVEVASDINTHVVTELEGRPPGEYRESFRAAVRTGLLPGSLARRLEPAAGLRNMLVHEYEGVDDRLVHGAIPLALEDFAEYSRQVERWLEEHHPAQSGTGNEVHG
ncbi:MAG: DUF86 domain-containing protein [Actinomycetota bacterium]